MLESPDYFFRVREIGRLRQTGAVPRWHMRVLSMLSWQKIASFTDKRGELHDLP